MGYLNTPIGRTEFFFWSELTGMPIFLVLLVSDQANLNFGSSITLAVFLLAFVSFSLAYCVLMNKRSADIDGSPGYFVLFGFALCASAFLAHRFFDFDFGSFEKIARFSTLFQFAYLCVMPSKA